MPGDPSPDPPPTRPTDLQRALRNWLDAGRAEGWSPRTVEDRRQMMERFCWWLLNEEEVSPTLANLDAARIRAFLTYARNPHPEGRFGCTRPSAQREARPATVHAYFRALRAFTNFCIAEGLCTESPLQNVKAPRVPVDQVQPLSAEQLQAMLNAVRHAKSPERNEALIKLLVDTGMRVSELTALHIGDVERGSREVVVTGKGNKKRKVYMGTEAARALWRYLEKERRDALDDEPLFVSVGGIRHGAALSHTGVHEIVSKAGKAAGITGVRCSPHTLRHTFAVSFLRAGRSVYELQDLMGHTDLHVLRRYVALAEKDLAEAHRQASPVDRMRLK